MGVPKRGNKRKKDNQKAQKRRVESKKTTKKSDVDEPSDDKNKYVDDEFKCLKEVMKIKNLSHLPLLVGATILENYEDVKRLLEFGYDPNEAGNDRNPPVIQAARYRCPEIMILLLETGADATVLDSERQDSLLMCVASNRRWEEKEFVGIYEKMKAMTLKMDLRHVNQVGNTIIHSVVKRHWVVGLQKLLEDGVPCDVPNGRGVTALMMAAARNYSEESGYLVGAGARVLQEDERGCSAICYAAVSLQQKKLKKPHQVLEYLTGRFTTRRGVQSWRAYIRRRLELLTSDGTVTHKSFHEAANKIATSLFAYICQNIPQGPEILLELNVFGRIADAMMRQKPSSTSRKTPNDYLTGLLGVTTQLLRCCQCCFGCGTTTVTPELMAECFIVSGAGNACLSLLSTNPPSTHNILIPIYYACAQDSRPQLFLRENYDILSPQFLQHIDSCGSQIADLDDVHAQMAKQRLRKAKTNFLEIKKELDQNKSETEPKSTSTTNKKFNSKKMRRKTKALKAKIDKIRRADILERANYVKGQEVIKEEEEDILEENWSITPGPAEEATKSSSAIRYELKENDPDCFFEGSEEESLPPKEYVTEEEITRTNQLLEQLLQPQTFDPTSMTFPTNFGNDRKSILGARIVKLQVLLGHLIENYELHWKRDRKMGYQDYLGVAGDFQDSRDEQIRRIDSVLPIIEQRYISRLRENFHRVLEIAMGMYNEKNPGYDTILMKLEESLIRHTIRGERMYNDLPDENDPLVPWGENKPCSVIGGHLMKFKEEKSDVWPPDLEGAASADDLYLEELSNLPPAPESLITNEELDNVKRKTVENAYHLVQSFTRIVSENESENKDLEPPLRRFDSTDDVMVRAKAKFFTILNGDCPTGRSLDPPTEGSGCCMQRSISDMIGYDLKSYKEAGKVSRWDAIIRNLQSFLLGKSIKKGEMVLSIPEMRNHFIISSGGNFGDVELGLDRSGRPLAVKKIAFQAILHGLVNQILDLQHRNVLPYVMCDYAAILRAGKDLDLSDDESGVENPELVLVTPLCEYNLGEYLMCLKMNRELSVTSDHLVRQMLQGLRYLHSGGVGRPPIIHGNLKPSNVLIDLHGTVKVAEFGIYKALYQTVKPPKSSVIWFSRETYDLFAKHASLDYSTASDIQVAGMLVHFVLTGGLHPFGIVTDDILENLLRGVPRLGVNGCELNDLISWMLVFESSDRPTIDQVLSHVYFWDSHKKWQFLLTCAGVTEDGKVILREIEQFHNTLNILAIRNNIIGDWVSIIREKIPYAFPADILQNDTPIGLLKFLRTCVELQSAENPHQPIFGFDLQSFFLGAFPALPLSLYRLIENTDWLVHPVFLRFSYRNVD